MSEKHKPLKELDNMNRLLDLIVSGETLETEFKEDRKNFSDSKLYDSVVGLTNTNGGTLIVGVRDTGEITGSMRVADGTWKNVESISHTKKSTPR